MRRAVVVLVGAFLIALMGVYGLSLFVTVYEVPTDSMEPTIQEGASIVVIDRGTHENLEDGEVIVFRADGDETERLVVHRIVTYADEGDDWVASLDAEERDDLTCAEAVHCPAPNAGYITMGDSEQAFDQATGNTRPVDPEWIVGECVIELFSHSDDRAS